jgi:hypothetical protein
MCVLVGPLYNSSEIRGAGGQQNDRGGARTKALLRLRAPTWALCRPGPASCYMRFKQEPHPFTCNGEGKRPEKISLNLLDKFGRLWYTIFTMKVLVKPNIVHGHSMSLKHSSTQALKHSSTQALKHSSTQALKHSSTQALKQN